MKILGLLVGLVLLAGCGEPISKEARQMKAKPIDCADAKEDIAALKSERASVLKQVGAGARFIIPVRKRRIRRSGSPWDMNGRVKCHPRLGHQGVQHRRSEGGKNPARRSALNAKAAAPEIDNVSPSG